MLRVTGDRPLLHRMIVFCCVRASRGVTMLRPRLHAIPERAVDFFAFCRKFVTGKRVTAGTGPCYCCVAT